ncbi:hypothetical protein AB0D65_10630 [Streptomyces griseoloalbus]|uniref:Uncharacterized protein n=1 Tax=Streptomyces griseoloalbus TaxID=67303 RepID=A0ABV3E2S9_9ACTN
MVSRRSIMAAAVATAAAVDAGSATAAPVNASARAAARRGAPRVTRPAVEYVRHPLGLDVRRPRLSWPLVSDTPGVRQIA